MEAHGSRDTNAQQHVSAPELHRKKAATIHPSKCQSPDRRQPTEGHANKDQRTTPDSAQTPPAYTHKAFPTEAACDIHVVAPKTYSQQIRHSNSHPLLPPKSCPSRARIQVQHCLFCFCKGLFLMSKNGSQRQFSRRPPRPKNQKKKNCETFPCVNRPKTDLSSHF